MKMLVMAAVALTFAAVSNAAAIDNHNLNLNDNQIDAELAGAVAKFQHLSVIDLVRLADEVYNEGDRKDPEDKPSDPEDKPSNPENECTERRCCYRSSNGCHCISECNGDCSACKTRWEAGEFDVVATF